MMHDIAKLLSLWAKRSFGFNRFLHEKDKKKRRTYLSLGGVWIFVLLLVIFYVTVLSVGLITFGLGHLLPAYLAFLASLLLLFFGFFKVSGNLFDAAGYDLLASLPIHPAAIPAARLLQIYVGDLLLSLPIILPGLTVYAVFLHPSATFYVFSLLSLFFLPLLPMALYTVIGTGIAALSARMKRKKLAETLLTLAFVLAVLAGSLFLSGSAENITPDALADLAATVGSLIGRIYPPALWLGQGLFGDIPSLLLFFGVSLAAAFLIAAAVLSLFLPILRRLAVTSARKDYKMGTLQTGTARKALFLREFRRYFASPIYVTNTIIGPIMALVAAVALLIAGPESITDLPLLFAVEPLLPFLFAAVFTMMTTTSVSVSMEGKHLWQIQSLPLSAKTVFDAKILLYLILCAPFYAITEILLLIALAPSLLGALWLLLLPACTILFAGVFGITVNLKFRNFHWEKEEQVVKQSAAAAIGGFSGFFVSLAGGIATALCPAALGAFAPGIFSLLLLGITALLYRKNNHINLSAL